tara:strand:+ start:26167 stop:27687 length:1521 start_codon:yes stop_codon:yes gene_type:complete
MNTFESVCHQARQAAMLRTAAETLEWDDRTGLPAEAGGYRAQQISMLSTMVHELRTDAKYGEQLLELSEQLSGEDPCSDQVVTVRELLRDWHRDCKLPSDLVEKISSARTLGQQKWDEARSADDFDSFAPSLNQIIDLKREAAERMAEGTQRLPYEALMDEYEPDAKIDELQLVFGDLRRPLVALIQELCDAPKQPDTSVLHGKFPVETQRRFCADLAQRVGFDFRRGRLDETSHPFCTTLGPHDCRILTRYDDSFVSSGLFGMMHEAGHGMYEQGLRSDWFGLPPGSYVSLGIHESQSRMWENQVGRSRPFWQWLFDDLKQSFSSQMDAVTLDSFYAAINAVQPSLIRVEADEVTYNLHIIIRFDLEQQLIGGTLPVKDLPDAWNDRYENDLGIRPASDRDGVLQDVHWGAGLFGYFPTYSLGNMTGAQLFAAAERELGNLDDDFRHGRFAPLLDWMRRNVHQPGRRHTGPELVRQVTGRPLEATDLVTYLRGKLRPLYGLEEPV